MAINKELFAKVRDKILQVPDAYDQGAYGVKAETPCGTRACIAGHALIESGFCTPEELNDRKHRGNVTFFSVHGEAQKLLGLSEAEGYALLGSAVGEDWKEPFSSRFLDASSSSEDEARVAADYINYIIRTGDVR